MITIQRASERGVTRTDWLNSRHSFSFGQFYDEQWVHFGPLRVLNDDIVEPGGGFPTHPHRDMEILTYVIEGALEHRDSTGGHGVIHAGELQRMSAGSGIRHSEFNHSDEERLRFLQIWIFPERDNLEPGYEQKQFTREARRNVLLPVAVPRPVEEQLKIHQNASMMISFLEKDHRLALSLAEGRGGYVYVISGSLRVGNAVMNAGDAVMNAGDAVVNAGDAVMISDESEIALDAADDTELVCFDLPMTEF